MDSRFTRHLRALVDRTIPGLELSLSALAYYLPAYAREGRASWDDAPPDHPNLEHTLARLSPGRALDLGCGSGRISLHLARRGWSVWALDRLARPVARARAAASREGLAVTVVQGRATRLTKLARGPYHLAVDLLGPASDLDAPHRRRYAAALRAVLAPDATVLVATFSPDEVLSDFGKYFYLVAQNPAGTEPGVTWMVLSPNPNLEFGSP